MIDVTVVLLERALPSTSLAPLEIFGFAGVLWEMLRGEQPTTPFQVRTVSIDGRPTSHAVPVEIKPGGALRDVRKTDLIVVPAGEFDPWRSANRVPVAAVALPDRTEHRAFPGGTHGPAAR